MFKHKHYHQHISKDTYHTSSYKSDCFKRNYKEFPRLKTKCKKRGLRNRLTFAFVFVALSTVTLTTWMTLGAVFDAQRGLLNANNLPHYENRPWQHYRANWNDANLASIHEIFKQINRRIFWAAVIAFFLASTAAAAVAGFLTRPLLALTDGAKRLAEGERGIRLEPPKNKDELYTLTEAFNNLVKGLEHQEQWRRNMVADIVHDLRTPLAVMRSEIEAMQDGIVNLDNTALERLHSEIMMLSRLVSDLRILSLAEGGNLPLQLETHQIEPLLKRIIDTFHLQAFEKGAEFKLCPIQPELSIYCDSEQIIRLLSNLVDNAIHYGHKNSKARIELGAKELEDGVEIWVRDYGEGLAPKKLEQVFERFYRGDNARTRKNSFQQQAKESSGSGLGLAIAKAIAQAHQGNLTASNHIDGGAMFSLYLPYF